MAVQANVFVLIKIKIRNKKSQAPFGPEKSRHSERGQAPAAENPEPQVNHQSIMSRILKLFPRSGCLAACCVLACRTAPPLSLSLSLPLGLAREENGLAVDPIPQSARDYTVLARYPQAKLFCRTQTLHRFQRSGQTRIPSMKKKKKGWSPAPTPLSPPHFRQIPAAYAGWRWGSKVRMRGRP